MSVKLLCCVGRFRLSNGKIVVECNFPHQARMGEVALGACCICVWSGVAIIQLVIFHSVTTTSIRFILPVMQPLPTDNESFVLINYEGSKTNVGRNDKKMVVMAPINYPMK